jgi:hypothetical protein
MKKLRAHNLLFLCLIILFTCVPRSWAGACDSITLPTQIKGTLEREFAEWNVVTPELLTSSDDRQIWKENYNRECPGIISGHFTGQKIGYAINLVRGSGKTLEQQIVFFEATREGFKKLVLDPPSHVDVVTVLRKFAPGVYKSPDSGRSVKVAFDTIGVSEIEAGTVVYYWDGKEFRHIATSV